MPSRQLPNAKKLERMLSDLLGVEVAANDPKGKIERDPCIVATYAEPEKEYEAALWCDVAGAAALAAALSMVPAMRAEESVKAGKLDEMLLENYQEVCNIVTTLLNVPATPGGTVPTLALKDVKAENDATAAFGEVKEMKNTVDISFQIPGYGGGNMSVLVA